MATDATDNKIRLEDRMRDFAATLNEKDRRRFAALEASERGHGGITYIASVLGCSTKTIERGIAELDSCKMVRPLVAFDARAQGEKKSIPIGSLFRKGRVRPRDGQESVVG